jgi:hypothetical protein
MLRKDFALEMAELMAGVATQLDVYGLEELKRKQVGGIGCRLLRV